MVLGRARGSGEFAATSSEVLGIMKQLRDEMAKDLEDATAAEEATVQHPSPPPQTPPFEKMV